MDADRLLRLNAQLLEIFKELRAMGIDASMLLRLYQDPISHHSPTNSKKNCTCKCSCGRTTDDGHSLQRLGAVNDHSNRIEKEFPGTDLNILPNEDHVDYSKLIGYLGDQTAESLSDISTAKSTGMKHLQEEQHLEQALFGVVRERDSLEAQDLMLSQKYDNTLQPQLSLLYTALEAEKARADMLAQSLAEIAERNENLHLERKLREPLFKVGVAIRRRHLEQIKGAYTEESASVKVINKGSDAAHKADIIADSCLFSLGYLGAGDLSGFNALYYSADPEQWSLASKEDIFTEYMNMRATFQTSSRVLGHLSARRNFEYQEHHFRTMLETGLSPLCWSRPASGDAQWEERCTTVKNDPVIQKSMSDLRKAYECVMVGAKTELSRAAIMMSAKESLQEGHPKDYVIEAPHHFLLNTGKESSAKETPPHPLLSKKRNFGQFAEYHPKGEGAAPTYYASGWGFMAQKIRK